MPIQRMPARALRDFSGMIGQVNSTNMPSGSVIQVVETSSTAAVSVSGVGTEAALSGLNLSITPKSSTSKLILYYNISGYLVGNSTGWKLKVTRDSGSTVVQDSSANYEYYQTMSSGTLGDLYTKLNWQFKDTPNTTSTITYTPSIFSYSANTGGINYGSQFKSTVVIMEIVA